MKRNPIKFGAIFLAASMALVSCVETEELDSVKAMREAKTNSIDASTALTNYQAMQQKIKNSYDSINYVYQLQVNKANADYNVAVANNNTAVAAENLKVALANAAASLAAANSNLALQTEYAKRDLFNAQQNTLYAQINFIEAQAAQKLQANNDPFKLGLIEEYNTYYSGGYLTDGNTYITNGGIFGLKYEIAQDNINILNTTRYKAGEVNDNASQVLSYEYSKEQALVSINEYQRIIDFQQEATSTQNNEAAYASLKALAVTALSDYDAKEALAQIAENTSDTAYTAMNIASNNYYDNSNIKWDAKNICDNILGNYGVGSVDGLQTVLNEATLDISAANNNLSEANKQVSTWKAQYDITHAKLVADEAAKNSADLALQTAQYKVDTANVAAPFASQTLIDDVTAKQTVFDDAVTKYNTTMGEYNTVEGNYNNAQYTARNAQDDVTSATEYKADITNDIATYNVNYPIYSAALAKEASLLSIMNAKEDAYDIAYANYQMASSTMYNASNYYWTVVDARDAMSYLIDNVEGANEQVALSIASAERQIADLNEDIVEYDVQIAQYSNANYTADYDAEIAEYQTNIANNTALVAIYEAKAAAILAQIGTL